jgi:tetraacyldisaccharide 4'-kinase
MSAPRILLVSNGFGESAILQCIARAIARKDPQAVLAHMPLVGRIPAGSWPEPVGPQAEMPSGGLVTYWNFKNIVRDLRAGLAATTLRQFSFLSHQRRSYDAVVAVGDVYCLAVCLLFVRLPAIFVATAKSEYVAPHSALECAVARRARLTFARDEATARALVRRGVRAVYAGNAMMDDVAQTEISLPVDPQAIRFGILPGSRSDAPANARAAGRRLQAIAAVSGRRVQAFVALAPAADPLHIMSAIASAGIVPKLTGESNGVIARGEAGSVDLLVVRGAFGDVLRAADAVLGQAGTGNEQAAGLGKPVIAVAERPESLERVGWYRMRQQRLLGDALLVLPGDDDEAFASAVVRLIDDPLRIEKMAQAGRTRMGGTGAASAVADAALAIAGAAK